MYRRKRRPTISIPIERDDVVTQQMLEHEIETYTSQKCMPPWDDNMSYQNINDISSGDKTFFMHERNNMAVITIIHEEYVQKCMYQFGGDWKKIVHRILDEIIIQQHARSTGIPTPKIYGYSMVVHKSNMKISDKIGTVNKTPYYSIRACFNMQKISPGLSGGMTKSDIIRALDAAGIDHNDFRKDNMIMVMESRYYIIDFGESNLRAPNMRETNQMIATLGI